MFLRPRASTDDWPSPDPKGRPMGEVRAVRDDIRERVIRLIQLEEVEGQRENSPKRVSAL